MKTHTAKFLPRARVTGLVTKEVAGELLVYDRQRDRAHCLNSTAAAIWHLCDGRTTPSEIARKLGGAVQGPKSKVQSRSDDSPRVDEGIVWIGLAQLRRIHLLEEQAPWPNPRNSLAGVSRREAIRRIAAVASITLPAIVSMTAPTAVQAAVSCGARCKACSTGVECCSGVCAPPPLPGCGAGTPRCA